jgi:hypothetical protein
VWDRGCGGSAARACPFVIAASGALLVALVLNSTLAGEEVSEPFGPFELASGGSAVLVVDPLSWWMVDGDTTTLTATWVAPGPACVVSPVWFRWSVGGAGWAGSVDPTSGPQVNFTTSAESGGLAVVSVRSVAAVACGGRSTLALAAAQSNITVVVPVSILNLSVAPDPVEPGAPAYLAGNVAGGSPPYVLQAFWGDSTSSSATLNESGRFELTHSFATGEYRPGLLATDSNGLLARSVTPNSLDVSSSFSVGLVSNRSETDVGVPVQLNATALQAPNGSIMDWDCDAPTHAAAAADASHTQFACSFLTPGVGNATVEVFPGGGVAPVSAFFPIAVEAPPTLAIVPYDSTAEVGQSLSVNLDVAGGVPPFQLAWSVTDSNQSGVLPVVADGPVTIPIQPCDAGSFNIVVRLTDSDGDVDSNSSARISVSPALNVAISSDRSQNESGAVLGTEGTVTAGAPPFLWFVDPSQAPIIGSNASGSLAGEASFDWWGVYRTSGTVGLTATVVDAEGGFAVARFGLETLTPFSAVISLLNPPAETPGSAELEVQLSGGLPPFEVYVNATDGEEWNWSLASDGTSSSWLVAHSGDNLGLEITVIDATGSAFESNGTLRVPAAGEAISPSPPNEWSYSLAVGLPVAFAALALVAGLRYRRTRPVPRAPPDPVEVLREIIEPSDGADRATVELLAEEAGVALDLARATLDRLIADGTVLRETDPDGGEAVSWANLSSP